jgi:hypothetical protein
MNARFANDQIIITVNPVYEREDLNIFGLRSFKVDYLAEARRYRSLARSHERFNLFGTVSFSYQLTTARFDPRIGGKIAPEETKKHLMLIPVHHVSP